MAHLRPPTPRSIDLARDQAMSVDAIGACIQLAHGRAWITEAGAHGDTILQAGDRWCVTGQPVVISALTPIRLRLADARPGGRAALRRWWRRLAQASRQQVRQLQFGVPGGLPWQ